MANFTLNSGRVVDSKMLPEVSQDAILGKGFAHYFGNEAQSKLGARIRKHEADKWIKAAPEGATRLAKDAPDMGKDEIKAWRLDNPDMVKAWFAEIEDGQVKALEEGTVGSVNGAARLDPLEAKIEALAKEYVKVFVMDANGIKPSQYAKDKPVKIGGGEYTFGALVARRIEKDRDNLDKSARKWLAEQARKAEQAKTKAASATSLEDLGL